MGANSKSADGAVWKSRPAIGVYVELYGVLALVAIAILVGLELWTGHAVTALSGAMTGTLKLGTLSIPYALEVVTAIITLIVYLVKFVGLVILRASNSYELRTDGLYVNRGIANLQNTFISAMAFSDARLIMTIGTRIVGRGRIVVEANDGRRFELKMIKDAPNVQNLIRSNLSHPTVRVEK